MMKDSNLRSLVKGVSWRAVGTLDTFVLAYFYFGDVKIAGPIALTEVFTKIFLYYLHERIWNIIHWGRHSRMPAHLRSLAKGVSWRFFGSIDTTIISYIYSGSPWGALKVGGSEVITKIGLFYLHERLWALIKWGRIFTTPQDEVVK
jgi:uncharacterized membrane protein